METSAAARAAFLVKRPSSARGAGDRSTGLAPAPSAGERGGANGPLERLGGGEQGAALVLAAAPTPAPAPAPAPEKSKDKNKGKRGRRRNQRPLFFAEQVMEKKRQPKKKYLATQRLRRDVERSQLESLVLDVNYLKQEIANLEMVRDILRSARLSGRATTVCNLMAVVHEYFEKIQYGFGRETPASAVTLAQKLDFVRAVFDENVDFGTGRGRDAFIAQCQAYTLFHALFVYEVPETSQVSPEGEDHSIIIVARNRLRVRVSRRTIETIFPHLLNDEVVVQQLINRELVYPCEITIYFDKHGRVVRHDAIVDFVSGLSAALNSLQQVMRVMDSARLQGSLIVYDSSRAQTTAATRSAGSKRLREPEPEAVDDPEDEEKRPPLSRDALPPVDTPALYGEAADESFERNMYASPQSHFSVSDTGEAERTPYAMAHASPSKTPAQPKELSARSRMSIQDLLSEDV